MVHALRVWRHYLLGKIFLLKTDHSSLTNYFEQEDLYSRKPRWNAFLSEFDMDIQHVKGKENQVVDALIRKLHGIYAMYYSQLESQLSEQLKEEAQKDPEYKFLWQQMEDDWKQGKTSEWGKNED